MAQMSEDFGEWAARGDGRACRSAGRNGLRPGGDDDL